MTDLHTELPHLDVVLERHAGDLGDDWRPYRNHAYRVANACAALIQTSRADDLDKVALAAAFHDLGIWTDHTFDYLAPSMELAKNYLQTTDREPWTEEIVGMVRHHHQIPSVDGARLVEAFRKADWVDVSLGVVTCGLPRSFLRSLFEAFPDAGFHKRLVQLAAKRAVTHPWSPLPMLRW
ncbi:MAG: HD domain-containing protein [Polyangiaceae bacterium]|nr:HD domain-containing protein [Polyangiaceae bacterium]